MATAIIGLDAHLFNCDVQRNLAAVNIIVTIYNSRPGQILIFSICGVTKK